ncbi:hypothetical protein NESM_000722000 [Novymonas esmeraldas]|uniref:Uncharacterized protein n=1 Tax=Novymonas esmeraldas TaxID=1808958 RepID=A0AAW0EVU5_9TRYP
MSTMLEGEVAFLLSVAAHIGHVLYCMDDSEDGAGAAPLVSSLTTSEHEVLGELLLLEKQECDYAAAAEACTAPSAELDALLAESPLAATRRDDVASPYTRFILGFYSSALYAQAPTTMTTVGVRLFQRFLCSCRRDALYRLHHGCGVSAMEAILRECLHLAGNASSTAQIVAPTEVTVMVLAELSYDAQEVSPLDYLEVLLPHIPYLSQMCQQASLLLLAHDEMVRQPSSLVALLSIVFTVRNMSPSGEAVAQLLATWPEHRQEAFGRMNAFLNCFA